MPGWAGCGTRGCAARAGRTRPVILRTNDSPRPKTSTASVDQLVGVGGVRHVVGGEDQRLGEAAVLLLVLQGVLLDLFEDLAVGIGRGDRPLDLGGVELPLVLQVVELFGPRLGIDHADQLALLEENALHADVRADLHGVVIDQVALADGAGVFVAVDHVVEVGLGVGGGRGGQADLDGVEMVQRVPPERRPRPWCSRGGTRRR